MSNSLVDIKKQMEKSVEHLKIEFSKMRVGRASSAMVESVRVEVYGSTMGLKEVAAISIPDARTITIQPWDRSLFQEIEKGILAANVGLTPMNDGKIIRLSLPALTEERRKEFVKQIKKEGEDAKVSVRNTRRDAMEILKKDSGLSEDELKRQQDEVQKTTDHNVAEVDKLIDAKAKEVMTL
ncbi:MAG: ribosome recycling factor [Bdellovibrionales bacterium]|nr:ribosome recycling factor [Bdellovibrionales bacterium]